MARLKYEDRGVIHSKLYRVWSSMISRCNNRSYYAGRGISVCAEWKSSFISFRTWALSSGYKEGLQIDRTDNNGNYCESNCRFVTPKVNCLNRRRTRNFGGRSSEDVAKSLGVTRQAINYRIRKLGMSLDQAALTPKTPNGNLRKIGLRKWEDDK